VHASEERGGLGGGLLCEGNGAVHKSLIPVKQNGVHLVEVEVAVRIVVMRATRSVTRGLPIRATSRPGPRVTAIRTLRPRSGARVTRVHRTFALLSRLAVLSGSPFSGFCSHSPLSCLPSSASRGVSPGVLRGRRATVMSSDRVRSL